VGAKNSFKLIEKIKGGISKLEQEFIKIFLEGEQEKQKQEEEKFFNVGK
jgi:hypothetical protein